MAWVTRSSITRNINGWSAIGAVTMQFNCGKSAAASLAIFGMSSLTCRPGAKKYGWMITVVAPCSTHNRIAVCKSGVAISMCASSTMVNSESARNRLTISENNALLSYRREPWSIMTIPMDVGACCADGALP